MRSSVFLWLAAVLTAALSAGISSVRAEPPSALQLIRPDAATSLLLPATKKCITIGGHKFCKDFGHKDDKDKDKGNPPTSKSQAPVSKCPLGTDPKTGLCICPAGQVNYGDGSCGKPCGYGMSGTPPKCRCVTGATLQVTGPTTKGCLCPDGNPPKEVDGNYACQNLGPQ